MTIQYSVGLMPENSKLMLPPKLLRIQNLNILIRRKSLRNWQAGNLKETDNPVLMLVRLKK